MKRSVIQKLVASSMLLLACSAWAAAQQADPIADVVQLRLRDGSIRWGSILEHSPDGVRFALLDSGGVASVRFSLLDPDQEADLRERFGYVDVSSEELMLDADRIELKGGEVIVGVILSREGSNFLMKVGGNIQAVPKLRVQNISSGLRVPALDIYTREELYSQYAAAAPADDPAAQLELAKTCERIFDFAHAVEHYERVAELDPSFESEEVGFALERAKQKAEQQEQRRAAAQAAPV